MEIIGIPTFWFRIQTLGTDIHSIEWTHDNPGSGNGWVCCHWRDGTIRDKIWVGVTKGIVDGGKLRAIYSDTELPTYHSSEQFYTAAQATGTAEGVTRKPIHHHSAIGLHDAVYLKYLDIRHTQSNRCRPGRLWMTHSVIGRRPVCVGVSPTGGYTQGNTGKLTGIHRMYPRLSAARLIPYGHLGAYD